MKDCKPKLFVIDDDPDCRYLATTFLEMAGYEVRSVDCPSKVGKHFFKDSLAILMDTELGVSFGPDYCQQFKKTYGIPVVGMSSLRSYERDWDNVGADGFIDKIRLSDIGFLVGELLK